MVQVSRFVRLVLPALLVLLGGTLAGLAVLTFRMVHPAAVPEPVHPSHYLLPSMELRWRSSDGVDLAGWWIPGPKGAPGIVMAPGHAMGRADVLSLASALHREGYNLLVFSQRGCGAAPSSGSTLGLREPDDLLATLERLRAQPGVDVGKLGVWGVDSGARAALVAAAGDRAVRAVVADSPFDRVQDFIGVRLREDWGLDNGLLEMAVAGMLRLYTVGSGLSPGEPVPAPELSDRNILFIRGENRPELGRLGAALFDRIEPRKEMTTLPVARVRVMTEQEQAAYDGLVVKFFHLNLEGGAGTGP